MDLTKTGKLIADLRREMGFTQKKLADAMCISPKTVSKWERGYGFPDVNLISKLCELLKIDETKLLAGEMPKIKKDVGNVKKTKFYLCDKCGNLLTSIANADVVCCGRKLEPLLPKTLDDDHILNVEIIEDDFYITFNHPMTKEHYISFVSYVRFDRVLTVKLYPEQGGEVRFSRMRGGKLYYCCSKHGLFEMKC